jgi:hypothetical protein
MCTLAIHARRTGAAREWQPSISSPATSSTRSCATMSGTRPSARTRGRTRLQSLRSAGGARWNAGRTDERARHAGSEPEARSRLPNSTTSASSSGSRKGATIVSTARASRHEPGRHVQRRAARGMRHAHATRHRATATTTDSATLRARGEAAADGRRACSLFRALARLHKKVVARLGQAGGSQNVGDGLAKVRPARAARGRGHAEAAPGSGAAHPTSRLRFLSYSERPVVSSAICGGDCTCEVSRPLHAHMHTQTRARTRHARTHLINFVVRVHPKRRPARGGAVAAAPAR